MTPPGAPLFSERMRLRMETWWGRPTPGGPRGVGDALHRLSERRSLRQRDEPDQAWRCCERWPRTLLNKWNAREFAARHGVAIPELLWSGRNPAEAPLDRLERFAMRPAIGRNRTGVSVVAGGRELLRERPADPAALRTDWPRDPLTRMRQLVLVEELVCEDADRPRLPIELKAWAFAGHVAAVQRSVRGPGAHRYRFYTPEWSPMDDSFGVGAVPDEPVSAPQGLESLLRWAAAITAGAGTFMRVDFLLGSQGPVFSELSSTPEAGLRTTPFADAFLGRRWAEHCGEAV